MKPIQSFNGYGHPWVGGTGSNKLDFENASLTKATKTGTADDFMLTVTDSGISMIVFSLPNSFAGKTLYISGDFARTGVHANDIVCTGQYTVGGVVSYPTFGTYSSGTASLSDVAYTIPVGATDIAFRVIAAATADTSTGETLTVQNLRLCETTEQAWSPYENICPISGWVGAEATRTGKNLLQNNLVEGTANGVTFTKNVNGAISLSGTSTANTVRPINVGVPLLLKQGVEYILTGGVQDVASLQIRKFSDSSAIAQGYTVNYTPDEDVEVLIRISINNGKVTDGTVVSPMVRLASDSDPSYEPYNGNVYPISWQTEAGTVYGGTIDFTSGVLTVTEQSYSIDGSRTPTGINTSRVPNYTIFFDYLAGSLTNPAIVQYKPLLICDSLPTKSATMYDIAESSVTSLSTYPHSVVFKMPTSLVGSDAASVTTYLQAHPMQIVAPLETPVTYQLTPQQITTLLGKNNIWVTLTPSA